MPEILFDTTRISKYEIPHYQGLIWKILSAELSYPQVKKLTGCTFHKEDVYRAKIDKQNRMIFTYVNDKTGDKVEKRLMILAINDHNYGKVKRQLASQSEAKRELFELKSTLTPLVSDKDLKTLNFLPAVSYNRTTLVLDDMQQSTLEKRTPLLLSGPPGVGKTVMLYNMMLKLLLSNEADAMHAENSRPTDVLFISQSRHLINNLRADFQTQNIHAKVIITTWADYIQSHYPELLPVPQNGFSHWLQDYLPGEPASVVHYELSLIAALGPDDYQGLAERQCHYANDPEKKTRLIKLLRQWSDYLKERKLFDPMVTVIPFDEKNVIDLVLGDEAQNQPPVAFRYLVEHGRDDRLIACVDSEQCLITSPYILSCMKKLLFKRYKNDYSQHALPKSWRCPPGIVKAANHLMDWKHDLDGNVKKRAYNKIGSAHATGGLVSWVNAKGLSDIGLLNGNHELVVIAEQEMTSREREYINTTLKTDYVLTAREAIGMDFKYVVLWKPFSSSCLKGLYKKFTQSKLTHGLTLDEWNTINALFVAITRAADSAFIFEEDDYQIAPGMWLLGKLGLNETSELKKLIEAAELKPEVDAQGDSKEWGIKIESHLAEGHIDVARRLMAFHLNMNEEEINARIALPMTPAEVKTPVKILSKQDTVAPKVIEARKKSAGTLPASNNVSRNTRAPEKKPNAEIAEIKPAANKLQNYITGLINCLSEKNIDLLIENNQAVKLLFGPHVARGHSLFSLLMADCKWSNYLLNKIADNWGRFASMFTYELLVKPSLDNPDISTLCRLIVLKNGPRILEQIIVTQPEQIKKITAGDLCLGTRVMPGRISSSIPFFWFCTKPNVLAQMVNLNPELLKAITAEDLCRMYTGIDTKFINTCPLYWLSIHLKGLWLLDELLVVNPGLAKKITQDALCLLRVDSGHVDFNTSTIYWFCASTEGRQLFYRLLELDPELALRIPASALFTVKGKDVNKTPFLMLTSNDAGLDVLEMLLTQNPQLFKDIPPSSISAIYSDTKSKIKNLSPLFCLSTTSRGISLLLKIYENNPKMAHGLDVKSLLAQVAAKYNNRYNCFALYNLVSNSDGLRALRCILESKPEIAKGITAKALCMPRRAEDGDPAEANSSVLSVLTYTKIGIKILKTIFLINPSVLRNISPHALLLTRTEDAGEALANCSALWGLTIFAEGREVLLMLLKANPDLATSIRSDDLTRLSPVSASGQTTMFFYFTLEVKGISILSRLVEANHKIFGAVTADMLCRKHFNPSLTPFYNLAWSLEGQAILDMFMTYYPHVFKGITIEALTDLIPESHAHKALINTSAFYGLTCTIPGQKILVQLIKLNPELMKKITVKTLCTARTCEVAACVNYTPLINLSCSLEGIEVLTQLLDLNPDLAQCLTNEDLLHEATRKEDVEETKLTAVDALLQYCAGDLVLSKLYSLNPGLTALDALFDSECSDDEQRYSPRFFTQADEESNNPKAEPTDRPGIRLG